MAYTQTDLDNIRKLIAAGAGRVSIAGKSVDYRSYEELKKIEADIMDELNAATGTKRIRSYAFTAKKGL